MRARPDVTGGQLAQGAGCEPDNLCYFECCEAWQADLDEWDLLTERDQERILELAEWVRRQRWVP